MFLSKNLKKIPKQKEPVHKYRLLLLYGFTDYCLIPNFLAIAAGNAFLFSMMQVVL